MNRLFLCLVLLCCLCLPACLTGGAGNPFVAYGTLQGNGDVRTDANVFLALGDLHGDAGLFVKGSGFPLTFPLNSNKDEWVAVNRATKLTVRGKLGVDPLPAWCADVFRPGELDSLSTRLGRTITVALP